MANITERLGIIETKLDEASQEILEELQHLRDLGLSPEAETILARLETKANALADIVPNP